MSILVFEIMQKNWYLSQHQKLEWNSGGNFIFSGKRAEILWNVWENIRFCLTSDTLRQIVCWVFSDLFGLRIGRQFCFRDRKCFKKIEFRENRNFNKKLIEPNYENEILNFFEILNFKISKWNFFRNLNFFKILNSYRYITFFRNLNFFRNFLFYSKFLSKFKIFLIFNFFPNLMNEIT